MRQSFREEGDESGAKGSARHDKENCIGDAYRSHVSVHLRTGPEVEAEDHLPYEAKEAAYRESDHDQSGSPRDGLLTLLTHRGIIAQPRKRS